MVDRKISRKQKKKHGLTAFAIGPCFLLTYLFLLGFSRFLYFLLLFILSTTSEVVKTLLEIMLKLVRAAL